jgi:DNA-binding transcriptional MerR regulator
MKTKELVKKTGATPEQVTYLRRRGILPVTNANAVNGAGRYYDFPDKAVEILKAWLKKKTEPAEL